MRFVIKAAFVTALALSLASLAQAAAMLAPGAAFPEWQLRDQTGAQVSSKDLAGKTYLLWYYPMAMTPGCTAEGKALRDEYPEFQQSGVEILGISFDAPEKNAEFVEEYAFPFRLLSDDGSLAAKVGATREPGAKMSKRVSYLVGPDGKVVRAYDDVSPAEHASQVLTDVRQPAPKGSE